MTEVRISEPIDPDVDLHIPDQRGELWREHGAVIAVIAFGGGLGAMARYGMAEWMPTRPGLFPWGTFATNVSGCFAIGVLMVLVTEVWSAHRLARPFLGTGFLGGFTTFSTYAVETRNLLQPGTAGTAFVYLAATLCCALLAVTVGTAGARAVFGVVPIGGGRR